MIKYLNRYFNLLIFSFIYILVNINVSNAQLDVVHYIPPVHNRNWNDNSNGNRYQAVYLSTPSSSPITVTITNGKGDFIKDYILSNAVDAVFDLNDYYGNNNNSYNSGNDDNNLSNNNTFLSVSEDSLNVALNNSGIILSSTERFYANFRVKTGAQASSMTAKGRAALGTEFYVGANPNNRESSSDRTNIFVSFMAVEDNTTITIDGFSPSTILHDDGPNITAGSQTFTLNAGQSYVLSTYTDENMPGNTENELIGAHITSTRPISMINGNMLHGALTVNGAARDMGMDQSVPIDWLGSFYAFIRGNNNDDDLETPIIIAISDNTTVDVNGTYLTTLAEGEYVQVNGANYSADGTMSVQTNKRAYAYQQLFGSVQRHSSGLNFIPPLSCFLPTATEFLPQVDQLHPVIDHDLDASITIVTYAGSDIRLYNAGSNTPIQTLTAASDAFAIGGTTEWIAYKIDNQQDNIRVESDGPLATGIFGYSGANGIAGYYTGFGGQASLRQINLDSEISGTCTPIYSLQDVPLEADEVIWIRQSDNRIISKDTIVDIIHSGDYIAVVTNGTCADSLFFTVSCVQVSCDDYDGDSINDIADVDADDDGILDSLECPLIYPVSNAGFDSANDWNYSSSSWSLASGRATTTGTNTTNQTLTQGIVGLSDACSDFFILRLNIASSGYQNNVLSSDTARVDISIGGNDIGAIVNPSGSADGKIMVTGPNVKVDSEIFPISSNSSLEFSPVEFYLNWGGLANAGDLVLSYSGQRDMIYIDYVELEYYNCGISGDTDQDGIPNCLDLDSDNDGLSDQVESCGVLFTGPIVYLDNADGCSSGLIDGIECGPLDFDGDGIDNYLDLDSDNDGILDVYEAGHNLTAGADGRLLDVNANIGSNGMDNRVEDAPDSNTLAYTISNSESIINPNIDAYNIDADGDECYDVTESRFDDPDEDGLIGSGVPTVDSDGLKTGYTFIHPGYDWWQDPLYNSCEICRTATTNPQIMYYRRK